MKGSFMTDLPFVSVIILNYNGGEMIKLCLDSVFSNDYPNFEVILVDNASNDNSVKLVENTFSKERRLRIIRNPRNFGFSGGNNVGIEHSRGEYIVLLNNDTIVDKHWLTELVKPMENDKTIGVAQSKLLSINGEKIDSAGDFINYFGLAFQRGWGEVDKGQYNKARKIFSARGASMMIRRSVINRVGLLDPDLFLSYEDIDFCWRVRLAGYKIMFAPSSVVYHVGGASMLSEKSFRKTFYDSKNYIITFFKNACPDQLVKYNPITLLLVSILLDILIRKSPILAYVKAKSIVWTIKNLRRLWAKRLHVQKTLRQVNCSQVINEMLETNYKQMFTYLLLKLKVGRLAANKWLLSECLR
jgi:GT2 family glycosyltransferase